MARAEGEKIGGALVIDGNRAFYCANLPTALDPGLWWQQIKIGNVHVLMSPALDAGK
jgi:hypothetical protein